MWNSFSRPILAMAVSLNGLFGLPAYSQTSATAEPTRLIEIGDGFTASENGMPGVSVLSMAKLPNAQDAKIAFLSTILRSNTVSTFVAGPQDLGGNTDQLFVSVRAKVDLGAVTQPAEGSPVPPGSLNLTLDLGGDVLPLAEFGTRLNAMVDAVAPRSRRIAFFQLTDPSGVFAANVGDFQQAVSSSAFEMVVAEIGTRADACKLGVAPELALIEGLGDRAPFGNGDGTTTAAEAANWLNDALARPGKRQAECNTTYAIVVRSNPDPEAPVAVTLAGSLSPGVESQLYRETFEAKFLLGSDDVEKVSSFLQSCVYCPNERELSAKLTDLQQQEVTRGLETSIWEDIRNDTTTERLEIYLANCSLCEHRGEVEALITQIKAQEAAREQENAAYGAASSAQDLAALRQYRDGCVACDFKAEAETLIAEAEADAAYQAENAALEAAMSARDRAAIEAWLSTCSTCDGKAKAEALQAELVQAETLIGPCLLAAGLPQQGGPRQLNEIKIADARKACGAAVEALPSNIQMQVIAARIDQADGKPAEATSVYDLGVAAGLPEAHGLAAYMRFAPADGSAPDLATAEALASAGSKLGDWLSKEILMLIYSRNLVTGHSPTEAVELARQVAGEGNVSGQFFLGYFLQNGIGTAVNEAEAFEWLTKAADAGYIRAYPFLAEVYERGQSTPTDPVKAGSLLWDALQKGDAVALARLTDQLGDRPADVIRIIQQNMRDAGAFTGRVDGLNGPGTVRAIQAYAQSLQKQG